MTIAKCPKCNKESVFLRQIGNTIRYVAADGTLHPPIQNDNEYEFCCDNCCQDLLEEDVLLHNNLERIAEWEDENLSS